MTATDTSTLAESAVALRRQAGAYGDVATLLRGLRLDGWTGPAAQAFGDRYAGEPARWFDAADALLAAAGALDVHADALRDARSRLDAAAALRRRSRESVSPDAAARLAEAADAIATDVATTLDDSTSLVVARLDAIGELAPASTTWPGAAPWWDTAWRAVVNTGVDLGNALLSAGAAIGHHPGDAVAAVAGVAMFDAGAGAFLGSLAVDATGVGAVAGVPAGIASAGVAVGGGALAGASIRDLVMHAASDDAQTPLHQLPEGERVYSTGPKGQPREGIADPAPPRGARPGWIKFRADNQDGWVWQEPAEFVLGSNARQFRLMEPTPLYKYGYTRYTNARSQPLDAFGKPTGQDATHFGLTEDGEYGVPQGWS